MRLSDPFRGAMPSLIAEDYANLKADIEANGLRVPILTDEFGNILDGHHRYQICGELGLEPSVQVERGLANDTEKRLRIFAINLNQRHLSAAQRRQVERQQKEAALRLLAEGRAVREVARMVGRPYETVRDWARAGRSAHPAQPTETKGTEVPMSPSDDEEPAVTPATAPVPAASAIDPAAAKALALSLASAGATTREIAWRIGRARETVTDWIKRPDAPVKTPGPPRQDRFKHDSKVRALSIKGLGTQAIAAELGIPRGYVTEALKRLGIGKAAARVRNPLLRFTERAEAEAETWASLADPISLAAELASTDQCAELAAHLDLLSKAASMLKGRLTKEATKRKNGNGQAIREARH